MAAAAVPGSGEVRVRVRVRASTRRGRQWRQRPCGSDGAERPPMPEANWKATCSTSVASAERPPMPEVSEMESQTAEA